MTALAVTALGGYVAACGLAILAGVGLLIAERVEFAADLVDEAPAFAVVVGLVFVLIVGAVLLACYQLGVAALAAMADATGEVQP